METDLKAPFIGRFSISGPFDGHLLPLSPSSVDEQEVSVDGVRMRCLLVDQQCGIAKDGTYQHQATWQILDVLEPPEARAAFLREKQQRYGGLS